MRSEALLELSKGVKAAGKIAAASNIFHRLRVISQQTGGESIDSAAIEIILKLAKAGGKAPLSSLAAGNLRQAIAVLREMERNGLVKILSTPFRTYAALTERGWKVYSELVSFLV
ncbi:MAG: hypothetical protein QXR56_08625 [Thermofilaceae archaeon]